MASQGGANLRFYSLSTSLHCEATYTGLSTFIVHCVPTFAGTHCTYPRMDGQAELTWMAG